MEILGFLPEDKAHLPTKFIYQHCNLTVLQSVYTAAWGTFHTSEIIQIRKVRGERQMLTCH